MRYRSDEVGFTMFDFKQVRADEPSIQRYSSFLNHVFQTTGQTVPYLTWLYHDNPRGLVVGYDAYDGDVLAGHYVAIPVEYSLAGRSAKGLLSLNTATHSNYRGKGLFTQLAERTYDYAKESGYQFVVGVANQNSTPGFIRKLGFDNLGPLDVRLGLGRLELAGRSGKDFFALNTAETLRWRLARPTATYAFNSRERAVYSASGKPLIDAYLGCVDQAEALAGISHLPRWPLHHLKMWIGIDSGITFRGLFASLPERLRPSPLNLIYRNLGNNHFKPSRRSIFFQLMDFDAY